METTAQLNARLHPLVASYYETHDEAALGQVLAILRPVLLVYARLTLDVRDAERQEDLVHDVLLHFLLSLRSRRFQLGSTSLLGFVRVICRNQYYQSLLPRHRPAQPGAAEDPWLLLGPAMATQPDELPVAAEHAADASAALTAATGAVLALDPPARAAVVLHYYQGLSVPEAAARLGLDEQQYRTRLGRGLAALRTWGQGHPLADEAGVFAALPHVHTGDLFTEPLRLAS